MNSSIDLTNMQPATGKPKCYNFFSPLQIGEKEVIDFREYSLDGQAFTPQGVIIDCRESNGDCAVKISGVEFTVKCAKGEMVQMPYPAPLSQIVEIEGDGMTRVYFVDYVVMPYSSNTNSGGGMPAQYIETIQAGAGVSINNADPKNPVISATGGGGGGGGGGFSGAQVAIGANPPITGADNTLTVLIPATVDMGGWINGSALKIPDGVSIIRLSGMIQTVDASGPMETPATVLYRINGGTNNVNMGSYIDSGFVTVTPGEALVIEAVSQQELAAIVIYATLEGH